MMSLFQQKKLERLQANKEQGQQFLSENAKREGVITLPSGLQYEVVKMGEGSKPVITDKVKVHYKGTLIDGKEFDSSYKRGTPLEFRVNGVIKGWVEALLLMPAGSIWKLYMPSELAYGDQQAGPLITPGSTLVFDVELLEVK
uniref:FKBP-type peptidyl-prolyl cis-trans isomerase n=1 Tax=Gynurincola endophyticus TaxID=2479004 RepID=UPI000F8DADA1